MTKQMSNDQSRTKFLKRRKQALLAAVFGLGAMSAIGIQPILNETFSSAIAEEAKVPVPDQPPFSFGPIVEAVSPAVVSVRVKSEQKQLSGFQGFQGLPKGHPLQRFFEQFEDDFSFPGQKKRRSKPRAVMGQGSGFFISDDGYIVTNNHVVKDASEVEVVLSSGDSYNAEVIGIDEKTDLALLKVDGSGFTYVKLSEERPHVGDWVLAVGNPFGLGGTVTAGIVSAQGRDLRSGPYDDFIQIDAAVNRGNSGGPTFNYKGEVVGVNTAIFSPSGGNVGIAFAIPSETVKAVIADLKDDGQVTRGWLGVQIQPVTKEIAESIGRDKEGGALVVSAQSNSPAAKAGLKSGDTILKVDGEPIRGPRELARKVASYAPGTKVDVTIWRNNKEQDIRVDLGDQPSNLERASVEPATPDAAETSLEELGMALSSAREAGVDEEGVVVTDIDPDGAAAGRGLQVGDIIKEIGGAEVNNSDDVSSQLAKAGETGRSSVLARVESNGRSRFIALPTVRG